MKQYANTAALAAIVLAAAVTTAPAQDTIKVGVIQPLTGAFAASGNYVANGAKSQPITFWTGTSNHTRADILTAAVGQWQQVLNLNVVAKPDKRAFPTCLPLHGPCQGWAVGWLADYPDPQDFLTLQFTTGAANNGMNASDPKLDGLLPKADVEQNAAQRFSMYNDAEQEAVNYVAWIPYAQNKLFWRQRTWVRGFGLNALQLMVDQNWPNVYIVEH